MKNLINKSKLTFIVLLTILIVTILSARRPPWCDSIKSTLWYSCLGAVKGRKGLIRSLNEKFKPTHSIHLVATLNFKEAIPQLRTILRGSRASIWTKGHAAMSLAELGDNVSISEITDMLNNNFRTNAAIRKKTFKALGILDPKKQLAFSREKAKSISLPKSTLNESIVLQLLPVFVQNNARDMLPVLKKWTADRTKIRGLIYAQIRARQMELGDIKLYITIRNQLSSPVVPSFPHYYIAALGRYPQDIPVLLRYAGWLWPESGAAYDGIERYVRRIEKVKKNKTGLSYQDKIAKQKLILGLKRISSVRENPRHKNYSGILHGRHVGLLARLGDPLAIRKLNKLLEYNPRSVIPWVAARQWLLTHSQKNKDKVIRLMAEGKSKNSPHPLYKEKLKLLDTAVSLMGGNDPRWAVMLMDRNTGVRKKALYHVARMIPGIKKAMMCGVISRNVKDAVQDGIYDSLSALTLFNDSCVGDLNKVYSDESLPSRTRGIALEVLAMMGQKPPDKPSAGLKNDRIMLDHFRRARFIYNYKEK
ncbi:MAG: hypothetical protein OEZ36_04695 [Spirochaetota bacterium]|nr:hypothetical protein [Spirochaetota bacterium]